MKNIASLLFCFIFLSVIQVPAQSIAREWNEQLLEAIRSDYARPTVHARNLFHSSVLIYDAWAVFDSEAQTVFLGKTFGGYNCSFTGINEPENVSSARHEVMSYAMFRLLNHRFANSPNSVTTLTEIQDLFHNLGYDESITSIDYSSGSYAALGNYLAEQMIAFGLQDNSNEAFDYANIFYTITNEPLILEIYQDENPLIDPNKWQPLSFSIFIDQSGNPAPGITPSFLSPEWGQVTPFALKQENLEILNDGFDSYVYNNPGPPVYIQESTGNGIEDPYKWHFALVAAWSAHMDPNDPNTYGYFSSVYW